MAQEPMPNPHGSHEDARQPLYDPYTGERLAVTHLDPSHQDEDGSNEIRRQSSDSGSRGRAKWMLGLIAVVVVLAVVGGTVWYINGPRADAQARDRHRAAVAAESKRQATCETLLSPTYTQLSTIDSKLDVGMVEQDYTEAVGAAQAAYDQIDASAADANHCAAYAEFGMALQQYGKASTYWNNCIISDYCTPSTTTLSSHWVVVSAILAGVKKDGLGAATDPSTGTSKS